MKENARQHARTLQADLSRLQQSVESAVGEADEKLRDAISAQPLLTIGAAAGLGFLLGGGLPRGTLTVLLEVGTRMAGAWLQQEFLEHSDIQENEQ